MEDVVSGTEQATGEVTSIDQLRDKVEEVSVENTVETSVETPKEETVQTEEKVEEKEPSEVLEAKTEEEKAEGVESETKQEYVPDFKFKVTNKEFEIPEKFRELVKTKEDEAELKDLFTKAYGIENIKAREQRIAEENEIIKSQILPEYKKQDEIINELSTYVQKKDFDSYFEKLGIDVKDVEKWMYQRLSLTPEQRELYNQKREFQKQTYELQAENQKFKSQFEAASREQEERAAQTVLNALSFSLQKSENKDAVSSYDAIHGAGAFQNKVIEYAAFVAQTEKKNLTPEEAVARFKQFVPQTTATVQKDQRVAAPKDKPVLPTIKARPHSPTGQQITSIKQLREKAHNIRYSEE